jgi:plastocyanin
MGRRARAERDRAGLEIRTRAGVSKIVAVFAMTVVVAVAGVAAYDAFGPSGQSTTAAVSSAVTSSTSSGAPPEVTMVPPPPLMPLISPGQTQNYSGVVLQPAEASPDVSLTLKAIAPAGLSFVLNQTSVLLSGISQTIPVVLKADPSLSPGNYEVTVEVTSGAFPAENKTFTVGVVAELVIIQSVAYHPQNITVSKGTAVTWINLDSTIGCCDPGNHDVGFLSGANATSPILKRYESWSYTFGEDGVVEYYCTIHPWMKGQVTVTG